MLEDGEQQLVLDIARKPLDQIPAQDCPCCSEWVDRLNKRAAVASIPSDTSNHILSVVPAVFKRHLASHLEQLALFAIPIGSAAEGDVNSNAAIKEDVGAFSEENHEVAQEAETMDLKVSSDPIIPTYEGFKTHAQQLNPRLPDCMVELVTQEQTRRYKRMLEFKVKHLNAVKDRNCSSGKFCLDLGGESQQPPPKANEDFDAPLTNFQITATGSSDGDGEPLEGTVISAQCPSGVPLPPVKRLPAEFECQLCFKVKKFYKLSDWTKHVHEDIQPFTCTFLNCYEPKLFKRKADWVRH